MIPFYLLLLLPFDDVGLAAEGVVVDTPAHLCGDISLIPHYNARVSTQPKYNATVQLLPTYNATAQAEEC